MSSVQKSSEDRDSPGNVLPPADELCQDGHELTPSHASSAMQSAEPAKGEARHSMRLPTASLVWMPSTLGR